MTTYRGQPVDYAVHDRKADTYSLIGVDDELLAELKAREFFSIPNRGNLEVRSGRYRRAGSKDQRSANRKSDRAGRKDAGDAFFTLYGPNASIANPGAGKGSGLSGNHLKQLQQMYSQWPAHNPFYNAMIGEIEQRPALKREGIVAGEIVGHRCWRLEDGWLRSVYQTDIWKPGCALEGREIGDWDQRGIHAWKDAASDHYRDYIRGYLNSGNGFMLDMMHPQYKKKCQPAMVTGTVLLWGDVVEHQRGWRAEFARVRSLDWLYPDETMMGRETQVLDGLRRLYGVAQRQDSKITRHVRQQIKLGIVQD